MREPLASGRTADIYDSAPGRVVKLFRAGYPWARAKQEAIITSLAREAGAPAPRVFGMTEWNGRYGIELERIVGPRIIEVVFAEPARVVELARWMARTHTAVHRLHPTAEFPSLVARLRSRIARAPGICDAARADLLRRLTKARVERSLCHGDFHPANLVVDSDTIRVIDWCDASSGPPEADVARTLLILDLGSRGGGARLPPVAQTLVRCLREAYAAEYATMGSLTAEAIAFWMPMVAAARLCERIAEEESHLLALVRDSIRNRPPQP